MELSSLFGSLGTIIGLVRAVPQLVRLLRARQAHGVSVDTSALSSLISIGWTIYGLLSGQPFVVIASAPSALIFALVTLFALRYGRRVREFKIAPIWLAVLVLAGSIGGKDGLGLILAISILVANLPQVWVAFRESSLSELSLGTWLLSLSDGVTWLVYGLIQGDASILTSASFQVLTSGTIVALKLLRTWKQERQKFEQ
jgi:uncharacterized protein with PQ loop repeat